MRPRKYLIKLQNTAINKLHRLKRLLTNTLVTSSNNETESCLTYVTVETLNTWSNFSRSFYLSCTLQPKTVSGIRVTTSLSTANFNNAIGIAILLFKPSKTANSLGIWDRRDEPTWHDSHTLTSVCTHIGCSNITNIIDGFSGGQKFYSHLPTFRNFYGHRNQKTEYAARQIAPTYGISATLRPSNILCEFPIGGTSSLLLQWINEIEFTIEYLCY
jgi:hypothetical protein